MNTYDRFIRSQQIIALHRASVPVRQIGEQFGLSPRQVTRIIKEMLEAEDRKRELEERLEEAREWWRGPKI